MNTQPINSSLSKLKTILIIDDDLFIQKFISKMLGSNFHPSCASTGIDGIEKAKTQIPDIILLDVEMPGMNGYEVCDALKHEEATANIPVIFLSGKTSIRERMLGYEAGAVDFLTKPCEKEELIAKLNVHSEQHSEHKALADKMENASKTALTAMIGNNELAQVIQFMESCYEVSSFNHLATRFFHVTNSLKLNCCLLFCTTEGNLFFSSTSDVTPLEKELIPALHAAGNRFHDFGSRTQITYPRVALLIKNMPINDMTTYGRYKDLLPSLLSATDTRIKSLDTEHALIQQSRSIAASFEAVNSTLINLADSIDSGHDKVITSMKDMLSELESKLYRMGLDDDQEAFLLNQIGNVLNSTHDLDDQTATVRSAFETISRLLCHLTERQQNILDMIFSRFEQVSETDIPNKTNETDIDIF